MRRPLLLSSLILGALLALPTARTGELPSVDQPPKTGVKNPLDAAVVIGLEDYAFVPKVDYARRDSRAFYDYLLYTRGLDSDRIAHMQSGNQEAIVAKVTEMGRQVGPGGTLWVYFAGHGAADPNTGDRLLLGDDVRADRNGFVSRAVRLDDLKRFAAAGGGSVVMVLDACYTGIGRDGAALMPGGRFVVPDYPRAQSAQVIEWHAAGPSQISGPIESAQHGAFTYFVLGALQGWADGELDDRPDGVVTLREAETYVRKALLSVGIDDQTPQLIQQNAWEKVLSSGELDKGPSLSAAAGGAGGPKNEVVSDFEAAAARMSDLQQQAASAWRQVEPLVKDGGADAERILTQFLDTYQGRTVEAEGIVYPVDVPETEKAAKQLAKLTGSSGGLLGALAGDLEVAAATDALLAEAEAAWTLTQSAVAGGGEAADNALRAFIERYKYAQVEVNGQIHAVEVKQVKDAEKLLERSSSSTSSSATVSKDRRVHAGVHVGVNPGLRVQWDRGDRRVHSVGLRGDVGLGLSSFASKAVGWDLLAFGELDLSASSNWDLQVGAGLVCPSASSLVPGLGVAFQFDPLSAFQTELGTGITIYGLVPQLNVGWVW